MKHLKILPFFSLVIFMLSCNNSGSESIESELSTSNNQKTIGYSVINVYPHDTKAFTEGLFIKDNILFESTGGKGNKDDDNKSFIIKRSLKDLHPIAQINLPKNIFGEGISVVGNKLYELTWDEHIVFVYDAKNFQKLGELHWPYEGWGMTTDGVRLYISTGSDKIYIVNPTDFSVQKVINVTENGERLDNINELEYVDGYIYANVFQKDVIVKIDLKDGSVIGTLDLSDIKQKSGTDFNLGDDLYNNKVLNGIAYDSIHNTLIVTGKNWPNLFELKLQ
ncbi:glutaminyl-peptide cyclotransferase [Rhizosphaericola mali]|uniref:Glutaminyl-peptide cyclotransferase n=1 Tax=Rhizosphaericola mali TaxID=2545455 RepID=A0A5P2G8A0_9BACT|nr:glutaminyl-peptide cyclotransferase [Rhizosphaericola mali]QES87751.1 glutaminyl-peptide cyclotransferase [Rhizosphaericola mali]